MKTKGFLLFAFLNGALIIGISVVIIIVAVSTAQKTSEFTEYSYTEYIDRTDSKIFKKNAGAQLYEAEETVISGSAIKVDNLAASGKMAVEPKTNGTIDFTIDFDEVCYIQIKLCICYTRNTHFDTYAQNLFSFYLNGTELGGRKAKVAHSYNWLDFYENEICAVEVGAGENVLEIVSVSEDYTVDYLLLVSDAEKTSEEKSMGVSYLGFDAEREMMRFEAEACERTGDAKIEYDRKASGGYYVSYLSEQSAVKLNLKSEYGVVSKVAVALKNRGEEKQFSDVIKITLNGKEIVLSGTFARQDEDAPFSEIVVGDLELLNGNNVFTIENTGGDFLLDYILLNADVNFSVKRDVFRYEAENGELNGGCKTEYSFGVSENYNVGYFYPLSSVGFSVRSLQNDSPRLSLGISYAGEYTSLEQVLSLSVNGNLMDLSAVALYNTGGYEEYVDLYVGKIDLIGGDNKIILTSVSGEFNLDYITLSHSEYTVSVGEGKFEAEQSAFVNGAQTENNEKASGGYVVGFNQPSSNVNFAFYSDNSAKVKLTFYLSSVFDGEMLLSDCFNVLFNGKSLDIYGLYINNTGSWSVFSANEIMEIELKQGLNVVSIISKNEVYNVDYITITAA